MKKFIGILIISIIGILVACTAAASKSENKNQEDLQSDFTLVYNKVIYSDDQYRHDVEKIKVNYKPNTYIYYHIFVTRGHGLHSSDVITIDKIEVTE